MKARATARCWRPVEGAAHRPPLVPPAPSAASPCLRCRRRPPEAPVLPLAGSSPSQDPPSELAWFFARVIKRLWALAQLVGQPFGRSGSLKAQQVHSRYQFRQSSVVPTWLLVGDVSGLSSRPKCTVGLVMPVQANSRPIYSVRPPFAPIGSEIECRLPHPVKMGAW